MHSHTSHRHIRLLRNHFLNCNSRREPCLGSTLHLAERSGLIPDPLLVHIAGTQHRAMPHVDQPGTGCQPEFTGNSGHLDYPCPSPNPPSTCREPLRTGQSDTGSVGTPNRGSMPILQTGSSGNCSRMSLLTRCSSSGRRSRRWIRRRTASSSSSQSSRGGFLRGIHCSNRRERVKKRYCPPTGRTYTCTLTPSAVTRFQLISALAIRDVSRATLQTPPPWPVFLPSAQRSPGLHSWWPSPQPCATGHRWPRQCCSS